MTQQVVLHQGETLPAITVDEAQELDNQIVGSAKILEEKMLHMYNTEGYRLLGFEVWGHYLESVAERAGIGVKALRRWNNAALLTSSAGFDPGQIKEGKVRPIVDTLSDRKGFTEEDRHDALALAVELAGGDVDQMTGRITQAAAWRVAVTRTIPNSTSLVERLNDGEISPERAFKIASIVHENESEGIEHILLEIGDPELARFIVNLRHNQPDTFRDLRETIEQSGYLPSTNGSQIDLGKATLNDLLDHLNEPQRMIRYAKAVEKTESYKEISRLAAALCIKYWGIHPEVPENLRKLMPEGELYQRLLDERLIKFGAYEGSA